MSKPIALTTDYASDTTSIPNTFFDKYLPHANGEFLKIFLYLLRWMPVQGHTITFGSIADFFDMTEGDVARALRYWENAGLLCLIKDIDGEIRSIRLNYRALASDRHEKAAAAESSTHSEKKNYTMQQIQLFQDKDGGDELLFVIQAYLGKPLSPMDLNTVMYFYDGLGFSMELIEYLFEYCVSNGHRDMRYIEKVAFAWHNQNIETPSQARSMTQSSSKFCYSVLKAFGISGRNASPDEAEYINRWLKEYGFSQDLILEAVRRTMSTIHKPEFNYTESILSSWKEAGAFTKADVEKLDEVYNKTKEEKKDSSKPSRTSKRQTGKFHNFKQRNYDYSELEMQLTKRAMTQAAGGVSYES